MIPYAYLAGSLKLRRQGEWNRIAPRIWPVSLGLEETGGCWCLFDDANKVSRISSDAHMEPIEKTVCVILPAYEVAARIGATMIAGQKRR